MHFDLLQFALLDSARNCIKSFCAVFDWEPKPGAMAHYFRSLHTRRQTTKKQSTTSLWESFNIDGDKTEIMNVIFTFSPISCIEKVFWSKHIFDIEFAVEISGWRRSDPKKGVHKNVSLYSYVQVCCHWQCSVIWFKYVDSKG